jgi:hypothetical protein
MIGTDFMGQVVIPIADLPRGRESESWYKLVPRNSKKDVVSGEVLIRILYSQETEKLNLGGMMVSSVSKRLGDPSSTSISPSSSLPNIGEEEYSAMDDMRSGEIDLIMPALFKYAASLPCLQIGLPAFAKWATTASVSERIELLEKYQSTIFDFLIGSATEFKLDSVVVFYALHTFGPFLRLLEAKSYFTSTVASLLANSLQEPPASLLPGEDRDRHCANCLISLSNACTSNLKEIRNHPNSKTEIDRALEATSKCQSIVVSSGALGVALSLLNSTDSINKHILVLIIKISHNPTVKPIIQESGFVATVSNILSTVNDPTTLWLALDALAKYAEPAETGKGSKPGDRFLQEVSKVGNLLTSLGRISLLGVTGLHGASIATGIVYLLLALSHKIQDGSWAAKSIDPQLIKLLTGGATTSYLACIPKGEHKPLLPEACFSLLTMLGNKEPELQKQFGSEFSGLAPTIVEFSRFPSTLEASKLYIHELIKWSVISKDTVSEHIQKALQNSEYDESTKTAVSGFLEKL